jgi:hypothetical protein
VTTVQFLGAFTRLALRAADGAALECDVPAGALAELGVAEGADVAVALPAEALRVFAGPPAGA